MSDSPDHSEGAGHSGDWDVRYARQDQLWSGQANGVLVTEMTGAPPGRALDVGCGEGADAIWLATQAWRVTAIDVSRVAIDRARAAARAADVVVHWVHADIAAAPPQPGAYDLVSVQYPALERTPDDTVIRGLLAAVAPHGTLLVAGHVPLDPDHARSHGFEHADYLQPPDIAAHLDESWEIDVNETRLRASPPPGVSPHTHDVVLRAHRRASPLLPPSDGAR
jgi:SAM-dependent methyltransferase